MTLQHYTNVHHIIRDTNGIARPGPHCKPVLFSGHLAHAVHYHQKVQTRRKRPMSVERDDILYVREGVFVSPEMDGRTHYNAVDYDGRRHQCYYLASLSTQYAKTLHQLAKMHTGIHAPRWTARTFLRVTRVWHEVLGDISDADLAAEGFPGDRAGYMATVRAMHMLPTDVVQCIAFDVVHTNYLRKNL